MAGDWIKMRGSLLSDPKLIATARELQENPAFREWLTPGGGSDFNGVTMSHGASRRVTVGALLSVWSSAREHGLFDGDDLILRPMTLEQIDDMADVPGIGRAMEAAGWAVENTADGSVTLPRFKRYNVVPMSDAERQQRQRDRRKDDGQGASRAVTESHDSRVEESREEKIKKKKMNAAHSPPSRRKPPLRGAAAKIGWDPESGWSGILDTDRARWASAYPACDLESLLCRMHEWLLSNPAKAHKKQWRRFITGWLSRQQERGGDRESTSGGSKNATQRTRRPWNETRNPPRDVSHVPDI